MLIKVWPLYGQSCTGDLPWSRSACWLDIIHAEGRVKYVRDEDCPLAWKAVSKKLFGTKSGPVDFSNLKNPKGLLNLKEIRELAGINAYVHIISLSVQ